MRGSFVFYILLLIQCANAQGIDCKKISNLSNKEIKKIFPFSKTNEIRLVSFKGTLNLKGDSIAHLPQKDGRVNLSQLFESKTLKSKDEDFVLDLLVNYGYDPSLTEIGEEVAMCYSPRNAILFLDKEKNVIGYIEICYECKRYEIGPESIKISALCSYKFRLTKELFKKVGITYGVSKVDWWESPKN
ncbi:MAG: hypothetical protein QM734_06430 [Cyclobacteriaceae bacterium]